MFGLATTEIMVLLPLHKFVFLSNIAFVEMILPYLKVNNLKNLITMIV